MSARNLLQGTHQLAMDAAEAAVRHDEHHVALVVLAHDRVDDGVDRVDVPSLAAGPAQIGDQLVTDSRWSSGRVDR